MFEHEWCSIGLITIEDVNVFVWLQRTMCLQQTNLTASSTSCR